MWAAGRQPRLASLALLKVLLAQNKADAEFVRWYIWALGKVGAGEELARVRPLAEALAARWGHAADSRGGPVIPTNDRAGTRPHLTTLAADHRIGA